jgi:hypothetical protein
MNTDHHQRSGWGKYLSPFKLTLTAVNAVCFGACLVLLLMEKGGVPLVFLAIGTGLSSVAGLTGAVIASRKRTALGDVH